MLTDLSGFANSRAVLVGVSAYEYNEFPPIRAARNSLQAMRDILTDPALCGWPPERVTVISNPTSASDLANRLADLAEEAADVIFFYYVGHGTLSARGELCITTTATRPNRPSITGLAWDTVADIMRTCPARIRIIVLDCCFAGQAIEALAENGDAGIADITYVDGVYTLTATTRNRTAHVPPAHMQDNECTSFTAELQDLVRSGIPNKPSKLSLADMYPVLRERLHSKGLPAPNQRGTDTVYQFPFAQNAAISSQKSAQSSPIVRSGGYRGEARSPVTHDMSIAPASATWVAAIHVSENDFQPLGAAVVLDEHRVMTCAHVVMSDPGELRNDIWVSFPKSADDPYLRRRAVSIDFSYDPPTKDLAILVFEEALPIGVEPAQLRLLKPEEVVRQQWWAFGFPDRDPIGDSADGLVGASLTYGWIRLDSSSRYLLKFGFSGGGLWLPEYEAVVGIVGQAHQSGDGRAIMLSQACVHFPGAELAKLAGHD